MYVRPQGFRYPEGVRLPNNYGGNTFREVAPEEEVSEVSAEAPAAQAETPSEQKSSETETAALLTKKDSPSSLFGFKGIGSEELLIFALILLLSDSEIGDDLILFLILLFFIK